MCLANKSTGKQYWRSLDELAGTPQFKEWLHREFPEGASELASSHSRRTLLKLMAASFGLAGLVACRRPEEKILPQAKGVEDFIPGNPMHYATSMPLGGLAQGLMVEAHNGRPTKVEGNPKHPSSLGAADGYAQASVLDLYDPDRAQSVLQDGKKSGWEEFEAFAKQHFTEANLGDGSGVWFLSEPDSSPSHTAAREHFQSRFPAAQWVEYSTVSRENEVRGAALAFGRPLQPHYHFDKADVVLSIDSDFLGSDAPSLAAIRAFSKRRKVESEKDSMSRLYVVESGFSITGAMADHRFRARSSEIAQAVATIAEQAHAELEWSGPVKKDLAAHRGRSIVIAGPKQPPEVHALAYLINTQLGNVGETVTFTEPVVEPTERSLKDLAAAMNSGEVKTLVIYGGNPSFTAPGDLDFSTALGKVGTTIYLGLHNDETAAAANWALPAAHYLESWGDARAACGTVSLQQPLIYPLYEGKSAAEITALAGGYKDQRAYDIVRNYWMDQFTGDKELAWRTALHSGVVADTAYPAVSPAIQLDAVLELARTMEPPQGEYEVVFHQSASMYDGRYTNNGWMQEAPDPMTKLVWDNAALVSPATARSLDVENGDIIKIDAAGGSLEIPVSILPGQADGSIALELGYGRTQTGRVGTGVGYDVSVVRSADSMGFAAGVSVTKTGAKADLVSAQNHHSMEGRPLVRESTLEHYREEPDFAKHAVHHPPLESLYENPELEGKYQWGMAIDLNSCTGCNACLLACQSENNIPIVGKEEVERGREMHWIRLDRYFSGDEEDPQAVVQPVACMHCEHAPCENVCPVAATVHSPEGLNSMTYNRCIGTRYCSNNCPYKVRRFNFFDWHGEVEEVSKMVFNPDVTVRMRGVMEKCTYCVQRIQEKKIAANAEGRRDLEDGEIQTACQQTCPAEAIAFGNIADPNSRVSKVKAQNRDYAMLEEINVKPRTTYLARLRNPNPELEPSGGGDHGGHGGDHARNDSPFRILSEVKG